MYYFSCWFEMLHFPLKTLIPSTDSRNFYLLCLCLGLGQGHRSCRAIWTWPRHCAIQSHLTSRPGRKEIGLSLAAWKRGKEEAFLFQGTKQLMEWWGNTGPDQMICLPLFSLSWAWGKNTGADGLPTILFTVSVS